MNFKGFGIKNFRSFDEEGIYIDSLKKINIFIGKNNSGKSNVLRFIKRVQEVAIKTTDREYTITDQFKRNGETASISFEVSEQDVILSGDPQDEKFKICINLNSYEFEYNDSFLQKYRGIELYAMQSRIRRNTDENKAYINVIKQDIENKVRGYFDSFKKVEYIPQFRQIIDGQTIEDAKEPDFNGNNIIALMFRMQNPDIGQEADRKKFDNVQKFVRELLKNEELKIQIPNTKDKIIIELNGERLPLSHLGTGIHQLVILCCALEIFTDTIFCIEEPEIHLHPELQRKFLDLLKRTQNRYFITTHSNVFLDYDDNVSIYHVTHDGEKSKVTNINNSKHNHDILDDLGYKNSDILQANGIIWVEGPSDRVFLNHWLHLKRPDLIEGLHYSILFYGGRLLSNLSYSPDFLDKTLIPLLKINRNAYVIIDKDGKRITDSLNTTKTRIKNEIGDHKCWITKGREIENYLSATTIKKWLKEKTKKELHFEYSHQEKLENSIKAANISGVEVKYETNKNAFSKELIKHIDYEDFKTLDLETKIDEIIRWIDKWNG